MKRRLFATLLAGAVAISMVACGGSSSSSGSSAASEEKTEEAAPAEGEAAEGEAAGGEYHIDVICKTLSSEYWGYIKAGAEAYAKEHPGVTVDVKGPPSETSYDEQMNMIQTDLGSGAYDGYIIAPLQTDTVATLIADTDKPVMALDSKIASDKVISFIGTGNEEAAKAGAAAAVEAAKAAGWEEIKCIEIAGVQGDGTNTARMNGYIAGIEENGGDFLEDEVQYADAVADKAVTCMEAIMSNHPEGVAIICANNDDMALAAANKAAEVGLEGYKNTIFLGFDGQIPAAQAILDGKMTMSTAQNPYNMAYMAVDTMVKHLNGEQVDAVVDSGYTIITAENAQEHIDTLNSYSGK
ncbi:MAG: sugar ABC transporter substrate-binding protein [Lachnospiraceae bacterium]|nr:sugar ABC transporter substrate-binding protein [Lachnospiraceae bacterium]